MYILADSEKIYQMQTNLLSNQTAISSNLAVVDGIVDDILDDTDSLDTDLLSRK